MAVHQGWTRQWAGAFIVIVLGTVLFHRISSPFVSNLEKTVGRLKAAQRIARLGNWEWDAKNNSLWLSEEIYRIFDLRPDQSGSTLEAFLAALHPDDRAEVEAAINRYLRDGSPNVHDHRVLGKDGTERVVRIQYEPMVDRNGKAVRMAGTLQDITDQKHAAQALKDSELRLRGITNTVADGIVAVSEDGIIESVNASAERIFGYAADDMIGSRVDRLIPPRDTPSNGWPSQCYLCAQAARGPGNLREVVGVRKDGTAFPVELAVGLGTTVNIYLPRARSDETDLARRTPVTQRGRAETVLVVEDDLHVREHAVTMLIDLGYRTQEAADGPSALSILEQEPEIALLFTDLVLPGAMSGARLASEARRRWPEIKILFTSGYSGDFDSQRAQFEEAVEVLEKPYRKVELAGRLRSSFDEKGVEPMGGTSHAQPQL